MIKKEEGRPGNNLFHNWQALFVMVENLIIKIRALYCRAVKLTFVVKGCPIGLCSEEIFILNFGSKMMNSDVERAK